MNDRHSSNDLGDLRLDRVGDLVERFRDLERVRRFRCDDEDDRPIAIERRDARRGLPAQLRGASAQGPHGGGGDRLLEVGDGAHDAASSSPSSSAT